MKREEGRETGETRYRRGWMTADGGKTGERKERGQRREAARKPSVTCEMFPTMRTPRLPFYLLPSILELVRTEILNVSMCCRNTKTMFHKELGNYNLNFPKHEMSLFYFPHTKCHISMHQPPSRGTRGNMRATREHEGHHCNPSIKQSIN